MLGKDRSMLGKDRSRLGKDRSRLGKKSLYNSIRRIRSFETYGTPYYEGKCTM